MTHRIGRSAALLAGALAAISVASLPAAGTAFAARPVTTTTSTTTSAPPTTTAPLPDSEVSPFQGKLVNPDPSHVGRYLDQAASFRRGGDEVGAQLMEQMVTRGSATWLGGWNTSVGNFVAERIAQADAKGQLATFVIYNIPGRDCGSYSAGGTSAAAYPGWVKEISNGIGSNKAALIVEPDALPGMDCLTSAGQTERLNLLSNAVETFKANNPAASVYLDAGHAKWQSTAVMASRLKAANVGNTRGFSLNVSNYINNSENMVYGDELSGLLGGKAYVVDTSRNGKDTYVDRTGYVWCNPPGRGVGADPSSRDASHPKLDAFVWAKVPGESDGTCNGGPSAGTWWPERARELAANAVPALNVSPALVASEGPTTTTTTTTAPDSTTTTLAPTTTTTVAPDTTTTTATPDTTTTTATPDATTTSVAPTTSTTVCTKGRSICKTR